MSSVDTHSLFPSVELPASLGGYLTFSPWVTFERGVMRALPEVLELEGLVEEECENPQVIADWRLCSRGAEGRITHRSEILLYRDGSDWSEGDYDNVGVLFCRRDIDQTQTPPATTLRVHIPPREQQERLLDACNWTSDPTFGLLQKLTSYLEGVVNDQSVWKSLVQILGEAALDEE